MARKTTIFDGRSFESMGITVERVHDPIPDMREELEQKPSGHGSYLNSLTLSPRDITLECRYFGDKWLDFDSMMNDLSAWLVTDDDRKLSLRNNPDQHYMAHFKSYSEGDRIGGVGIGGFELTFCATDPIRYGESRAVVTTSSQTFEVGGTDRADLSVIVRNARPQDGKFGITLTKVGGGASYEMVTLIDAASSLNFDCVNHICRRNEFANGLTLSSRWPDFTPGKWKVTITKGTGTATLSWVQRYR